MIYEQILVIDDDPRIIKSLKMIFPEYEIIDFSNGHDALSYLKKPNEISLTLLDVMMPGMDGLSVLHEIKKINQDIAVIMMTAFSSQDIAVQALRNRADDFIEKPFNIPDLKDKIESLLKSKTEIYGTERGKSIQVERIERFIQRNYNNVSLRQIADQMCLSPKYVSRLFNKNNGSNFRKYKLQVKMEKAKSLLRDSSYSVDKISFDLGYQNPESFMRIFKHMTSLTPTQYRRSVSQKEKNRKTN